MENKQCSAKVWDYTGFHQNQCSKKAKVERDCKYYCTIHDPEYIKEKARKSDEKYRDKCCNNCKYLLRDYWKFCPSCGTKK